MKHARLHHFLQGHLMALENCKLVAHIVETLKLHVLNVNNTITYQYAKEKFLQGMDLFKIKHVCPGNVYNGNVLNIYTNVSLTTAGVEDNTLLQTAQFILFNNVNRKNKNVCVLFDNRAPKSLIKN